MDLAIFPPEITQIILEYLPIKDLVRAERTSKLLQLFCLSEIERRIKTGALKDEFGLLIHIGQTTAQPQQFDPITKTVQYIIPMDPITINTMYDHRRHIQCSLLRKQLIGNKYLSQHGFTIPVEKGMVEGKTIPFAIQDKHYQLDGSLTRMEPVTNKSSKKLSLAPTPLSYSLQVTGMRLPLSTIAA
ncbi:uncharacterized protein BX664DRAFT_334489 [Halteromyces radiatus]|uniref:uncharacterized protein n=1 Tax=Halteromyces radiatus TaxID=101107 RepID=UPI00221FD320|nr:uncharacterized protein BX664DRAFT_334489 [Halteromyces radiatus]KAI8090014.1 hypothetical protein BX664DRAFT_334489 [Halteromyces radiatus]